MIRKITGIIVAGGASSRMGAEKGLVDFGGKHLIEYSIDIFKVYCNEILISTKNKEFEKFGLPVISDNVPSSGPLAGIYSCLMESSNDINLILPCDTPFINIGLFDYILDNINGFDCVVPYMESGKLEPLCAYYNKNLLPIIKEFIDVGNYRIPDIYKIIRFNALKIAEDLPFYHNNLFKNLNYPQDL